MGMELYKLEYNKQSKQSSSETLLVYLLRHMHLDFAILTLNSAEEMSRLSFLKAFKLRDFESSNCGEASIFVFPEYDSRHDETERF